MTISFLAWIKKLRHPKRISCGGGEITAEEWRSAATLMRRRGSNPPAPATGSKPEPPAVPLEQPFQAQLIRYWDWRNEQTRGALAGEPICWDDAPPCPHPELHRPSTPTPLQAQILAISQDMRGRAEAERAAAAQLREIVESLAGFVAADQGSIPPPPPPKPTGGRQIRGDVDPEPAPSPLLMAVRQAIDDEPFGDEPRAVLLAVARWLRAQGAYTAVALLEREAGE